MISLKDFALPDELLQQVTELGLNSLPETLWIVMNAAIARESEKQLDTTSYERSSERRGQANGY